MKRRAWKWVLGLIVGLALAVGGFVWDAHRRATAVFERHELLVKEGIKELRAHPGGHPCLFGPVAEGDGWPFYDKALLAFEAVPDADGDVLPTWNGNDQLLPDSEKLDQIFEKYAPLIDLLRDSSRRMVFAPTYPYEEGNTSSLITGAIRATKFLCDRATRHVELDQRGAALDCLTLGLAVGHDTGRSGTLLNFLVFFVCDGICEYRVKEMLSGHSFDTAELRSFAEGLDRLWSARPRVGEAFRIEELTTRQTMIAIGRGMAEPKSYLSPKPSHRGWRYLFSRRLAYAAALGEYQQLMRKAQAIDSFEGPRRLEEVAGLSRETEEIKNPVVRDFFASVTQVYQRDALARLNWTLMRLAVGLAWYESERGSYPEKLDDLVPKYVASIPCCPLTFKALGYRDGKVWSPGKNGIDDGGVPGLNDDVDDEGGDVVWAVRRE